MATTTAKSVHVGKTQHGTDSRAVILQRLRGLWTKRTPDPLKELSRMRKEWK